MCVISADWLARFGDLILRTEPCTENTIYWDGGRKKIEAWKGQYLPSITFKSVTSSADHGSICEHNQICSVLGLRTIKMEKFDDQPSLPLKSTAKKTNLDFLVYDKDKDVDPRT
jgi:hypothetical protein